MRIAVSSFSNIGPRSSNQDRILVPHTTDASHFVVAIADGIGGAAGGAEAAEVAINNAAAQVHAPADMAGVFPTVIEQLRKMAQQNTQFDKLGTTLSIGTFIGGSVHVAHVGDTRIYHLRGTGLNTLTVDQTEVAELRRKGVLTENQAKRYPRRNVLLSALNPEGIYDVHTKQAALKVGDRVVFTTDGVHQRVKRGGILQSSLTYNNVADFISDLEKRTADLEPSDNYSAIGVEIIALE